MRLALALLLTPTLSAQAPAPAILPLPQITTQAQLEATVRALDTALFGAYNHCADPAELAKFDTFFTTDVEFWHDQPNASTFGLPALSAAIQQHICGKVTRQLLPGTLCVYPMHGTGALEIGQHQFFHTGSTASAGHADFIHLWVFRDGHWKIARVLSYDHNAATPTLAPH